MLASSAAVTRQDEREREPAVAAREQAPGDDERALGSPGRAPCRHCRRAAAGRASRAPRSSRLTRAGESQRRGSPAEWRVGRHRSRAMRRACAASTVGGMDATIETHGLTKRYGADGRRRRSLDRRAAGPGHRVRRPERRRQDDDDAAPARSRRADSGEALVDGRRYATITRPLTVVGALLDAGAVHPEPLGAKPSALARPEQRDPGGARRPGARARRALRASRAGGRARSRSGCDSVSASPRRCSATLRS